MSGNYGHLLQVTLRHVEDIGHEDDEWEDDDEDA
jgi:hypothetical protein